MGNEIIYGNCHWLVGKDYTVLMDNMNLFYDKLNRNWFFRKPNTGKPPYNEPPCNEHLDFTNCFLPPGPVIILLHVLFFLYNEPSV